MLLVVCLGARVVTGSYVGRVEGEARVLLAPCVTGPHVCTACARACGSSVQQFYWAYGRWYRLLVFFGLQLHKVIGARCTYGRLHDMGRFEQLTCNPR